jgi:hypothetical protein
VLPEPQPLVLVVCLLVQELHYRQLLRYRHLLLVFLEQLQPLFLLCLPASLLVAEPSSLVVLALLFAC